jgi:hypothetical protein
MKGNRVPIFLMLAGLMIVLASDAGHTRARVYPPEEVARPAHQATGALCESPALPTAPQEEPLLPSPGGRAGSEPFTFVVTADVRTYAGSGQYDTPQFFRGACEASDSLGGTAFMVSPGDVDPPAGVGWTIEQYLGQEYPWYPVVGNHETETPEDMEWLRGYDYDRNGDTPPNLVNVGPSGCQETTYSFDYANSHFVVLNEYCDGTSDTGTSGDVVDALYDWLVDDLSNTAQTHTFVFGHEPAYPQPDADNGRLRHESDSLNAHPANRDRFWSLLRDEGVVAYICGHTHNYSAVQIDGVWQLDAGHARGLGDTDAPSTFILVHVNGDLVTFETYRDDASGGSYALAHSGVLTAPVRVSLPLAMHHYHWLSNAELIEEGG